MLSRSVVGLSHPIHPGMPRWPGDPPVEFEPVAALERDGFFLRRFSLGEHNGTHLNAPASFYPGGMDIAAYPDSALVAPAVVMDVRAAARVNPDYRLSVARVLAWERRHGAVPAGSLALLFTGWQDKWSNPAAYLGVTGDRTGAGEETGAGADPGDSSRHFPGFGIAAVELLLTRRGVAGVGIDTHGVDGGQDDTFAVNRRVLGFPEPPRIVLENLTNLDQLPPAGAVLVIGALRLKGGSGSPVAVTAFLP